MSSVTLGGVKHALAPATIGRLEALQTALTAESGSPIARSVGILNTVLAAPIDDKTAARMDELHKAVRDALAHAGFKEAAPGEGAAPASGA